jgi:hypothetical protein
MYTTPGIGIGIGLAFTGFGLGWPVVALSLLIVAGSLLHRLGRRRAAQS